LNQLTLGEVVLIRMEFHQAAGAKVRPAVVLLDAGDDDFVAAPITSQPRTSTFDFEIREWQAAGLNVRSWVRVHKLTVLSKEGVVRRLGVLSVQDHEVLTATLRRAFSM
jgi:mRNA interferase MazF